MRSSRIKSIISLVVILTLVFNISAASVFAAGTPTEDSELLQ